MRYENLIFDLDGTLVDSLPGIEASLRAALALCQPHCLLAEGRLRPLVGPPLAKIIGNLWPDLGSDEIAVLVTAYREHYLRESCAKTEPFAGVTELLQEFHRAGITLFVLTNKPRAQTEVILNRQGWKSYFQEIGCPDDSRHPFASKADGAVSLRERHGLAPALTLFVGDAPDDARAAAAGGFAFAWAGYGYGKVSGHEISSKRMQASIGAFAELRSLIFSQFLHPSPHDNPESLR